MNAEIITSGTELLLGEIVDTNSVYIARALRDIGVNLYYKTSVGDNILRTAEALRVALSRADVVIVTGGLGPTVDDVTREAVAEATGCELALSAECLAQIEALMARWGRPLKDNNRRQAYLPAGAQPIPNPVGTAPGFILETPHGAIIAVPGVPREMERLMQDTVLPYLKARLGAEQSIIKALVLRTVGLPESWIDEQIDVLMRSANPTVGLAAHLGMVDIRITARAADEATADAMIAPMAAEVTARVGADAIYGTGADRLEAVTGALMAQAERKVAILESATQGEIARLLCSTPEGASVVTQWLVIDGPEALAATLNLSPAKMAEFGWVSEMVAAEAAATLIDTYEGGWGLAVLGSAADSGDVYGEHPGETYLALGTPSTTRVLHYPYGGAGELARRWIVLRALDVLRREALKRIALQTSQ
jgi:nicotinamide-nucleotide amidase